MHHRKTSNLVAAAILLTFLFSNAALSQPTVEVWGSQQPQLLERHAQACLAHLGVWEADCHITIVLTPQMPAMLKGATYSLPFLHPTGKRAFKVLMDASLGEADLLRVLSHEMIHIKQYVKRELVVLDERCVLWKGEKHICTSLTNRHAPWEDEAYGHEYTVTKAAKKRQCSPIAQADCHTPEKPPLISLPYLQ